MISKPKSTYYFCFLNQNAQLFTYPTDYYLDYDDAHRTRQP